MEAIGRNWRVGVVLAAWAGLLLAIAVLVAVQASRPAVRPARLPAVSAPPPATAQPPVVDLDRLYDLDHLVFGADPVVDLRRHTQLGDARRGASAVPEAPVVMLWILTLTGLCTLYVPSRSW